MEEEIKKIIEEKLKLKPVAEYKLVYDAPTQQLEPIYYWLLDFTRNIGFDVEKLIDNFTASPGSGYFAEIGRRASVMQEKVMQYLGAINTVIKSIINLLWDLKEFEIRLQLYDGLKSNDEKKRIASLNALKEIWITNVDIKKGRGAINMLTSQLEFVTLRDAFFVVKNEKDVDKLDVNERVKNILRSRIREFNEWVKRSEIELRNRFKIEKTYLKSQVASLKLYARWARPYIKAAEQLMMKETKEAALVSAFSTMLLNLLLLCKKEYKLEDLPPEIAKHFSKKNLRKFYGIVFIDFSFRSIPRIASREGYYSFGGRTDISFEAYVFNEDQLSVFEKEFEKKEFEEIMRITSDITEETLKTIAADLKHFLEEDKERKDDEEKKGKKNEKKGFFSGEGIITDIISIFKGGGIKGVSRKTEKEKSEIPKEDYYEEYFRKYVEEQIKSLCFKIYDVYKKAHGMPSYPSPYE